MIRVRTVSYDIDVNGCVTTGHRKYISKIRNADEETVDSGNTRKDTAGAESQAGSQQ